MNKSIIYELNENGDIKEKAIYTVDSKQALINYIMQFINNNHNTWTYQNEIEGIRESKTKQNCYYYDYNNIVIASYPSK